MGVPDRLRDLDTRRRWARLGAPAWFLGGVVMVALANASLVVLALAAWVRLHSWWSGTLWEDSGVWHWLPGGVIAVVALALAISMAYLVLHGMSSAPGRVIASAQAQPSPPAQFAQIHNVATELAIGLGVAPPELFVTAVAAPNALSAHGLRRRVIVHTAGLAALPRDEIEAMLAHEMGHLHAADARWVTAASVSLGHARRYANLLKLLGGFIALVFFAAWHYGDVVLPSWLAGGIVLLAVGAVADFALGHAKHRVRKDADDVADVVAVRLARNPESLGQLLQRLEVESSVVQDTSWRTAMLWFEEMPDVAPPPPSSAAAIAAAAAGPDSGEMRRTTELRRRAHAAYATANMLPPPNLPR